MGKTIKIRTGTFELSNDGTAMFHYNRPSSNLKNRVFDLPPNNALIRLSIWLLANIFPWSRTGTYKPFINLLFCLRLTVDRYRIIDDKFHLCIRRPGTHAVNPVVHAGFQQLTTSGLSCQLRTVQKTIVSSRQTSGANHVIFNCASIDESMCNLWRTKYTMAYLALYV